MNRNRIFQTALSSIRVQLRALTLAQRRSAPVLLACILPTLAFGAIGESLPEAARPHKRVVPRHDAEESGGGGWQILLNEGFEGAFPEANNWRVPPPRPGDEAQYRWDDETFNPHSGNESGWCAGLALDGIQLDPATDNYPHDMRTWMIFGPFSATDATVAELDFWQWVDTTPGDSLFFGISTNEINYLGYFVSGGIREWEHVVLDVETIIGPLNQAPQVWIGFLFFSNQTGLSTKGVFLDDIVVRKLVPGPNCEPSTDELQFGSTRIPTPVDRTFRIKNSGTEPLNGTMDVDCAAFAIVEGNQYSIAAGDSLERTVRFTPTQAGLQSCTIDLGSDLCSDLLCEGTGIANQAPTLVHQPVSQVVAGSAILVQADVTDPDDPVTATLHYRVGGDDAFTQVLMTGDGAALTATIPGAANTLRGVDYYLSASDGEITVTQPLVNPMQQPHRVTTVVTSVASPEVQPGGSAATAYRLVSVPGLRENASSAELLIDDLGAYDDEEWRLFRYEAGTNHEYPDARAASLAPGRAYWLIVRQPGRRIDANATTSFPTSAPYSITLAPGWNDIANPFLFSISTLDTEIQGGVAVGPYVYNGQWIPPNGTTQLDPWSGYAYFNPGLGNVTLVLQPRAIEGFAEAAVREAANGGSMAPAAKWSLRLAVRAGRAEDTWNELGLVQDASTGKDAFDFVEPRGVGTFASLAFLPPHLGSSNLTGADQGSEPDWTRDFRPLDGSPQRWLARASTNGTAPMFLSATESGALPAGFVVRAFEAESGRPIDLLGAEAESIRIANGSSLVILAGTPEDIDAMARAEWPTELSLFAGPNPARSSVSVSLRSASAGRVHVGVWDVMGRHCGDVFVGSLAAGAHSWTWNPGPELASGLYWIRARTDAEAGERVQKVLLLR